MAQIGSCWVSTSWVSVGGWAEGTWGGGVTPEPEAPSSGGGMAVKKRRYATTTTHGRFTSVDGTLYRQMFPEQPTTTTTRDAKVPVALLLAFMAGFDDS